MEVRSVKVNHNLGAGGPKLNLNGPLMQQQWGKNDATGI